VWFFFFPNLLSYARHFGHLGSHETSIIFHLLRFLGNPNSKVRDFLNIPDGHSTVRLALVPERLQRAGDVDNEDFVPIVLVGSPGKNGVSSFVEVRVEVPNALRWRRSCLIQWLH
jgi:hypothetical protein